MIADIFIGRRAGRRSGRQARKRSIFA